MLGKAFDYATFEPQIIEKSKNIIATTTKKNLKNETFTIILPPPNITGSLHLGHAFTSTIQDILLRFKRQHGYITLGQPGIDHAGIATQIVVAHQLQEQGISWRGLGREQFIQKVWEWKKESGGKIVYQLMRLGISIDLERLRFTMDENSSRAVLHAFTTLYNNGLIYKAKRIINWDPVLKTAVSDLEVSNRQEKGKLWYIRYKVEGENNFITVATTRPETLFGDQAVAVHPDDERYKHLIGKKVCIPLMKKNIPIIADAYSDPEKGSGIVKITPAHDFNDFEVGQRHNLSVFNIMDETSHLNINVPKEFQGLSCEEARKKVLESLDRLNLLEKIENITHSVPYNDRSGAIIEPRVTDQWFLDTKRLAQKAIEAVETEKIKFVPEQWKHTYFEWLKNIQPWCLSRQIWWGHQIPVWYAPNGKMFCATTEEEAQQQAALYFGIEKEFLPRLIRDRDVLDTWFSSALWPFLTLGWPETTIDLKKYYPTDILVTGFDIIFFWVSRMIMFSLYFIKEVPFKTIYINPLVRDEKGQKMSKSKGNVIDPLHLMDQYGADALRFTLATLAIPGRDIRISASLVENGRNFITKIWNAAKFLEINQCLYDKNFNIYKIKMKQSLNIWIVHKLIEFKKQVEIHLENNRFDFFAQNIQKFFKEIFCDIYIEGIKACLLEDLEQDLQEEIRRTSISVFAEFLKVSHPIIPFVTEYLWNILGNETMLLMEPWIFEDLFPKESFDLSAFYISVVEEIRSLRGMIGVASIEKLDLLAQTKDTFMKENQVWIKSLCRLEKIETVTVLSKDIKGIYFVKNGREFCLKYPQNFDISKAKVVFEGKMQKLEEDLQKLSSKIENIAYKAAKPEQWENDQKLKIEKENELKKMKEIHL